VFVVAIHRFAARCEVTQLRGGQRGSLRQPPDNSRRVQPAGGDGTHIVGRTTTQAIRSIKAAGDQGVPQGADVRASRLDPGFEIYAGLPLACRMASDECRLLQ